MKTKRISGLIKKHRGICIGTATAVLVAAGGGTFFVLRARGEQNSKAMQTIQDAEATVGNLNSTVVGTGTIKAADTTEVTIPKGVVIDSVQVKSGQAVEAGDVIATVTEASVASVLLDVKADIEEVEEDIESLSDEASDAGSTEYLKKLVLESELVDLRSAESLLTEMISSKAIVATQSGIINSLDIEDGSTVGSAASSGTDTGSNDNLTASGSTTGTTSSVSVARASTAGSAAVSGVSRVSFTTVSAKLTEVSEASEDVAAADAGENTAADISQMTAVIPEQIIDLSQIDIKAPKTGEIPQQNITSGAGAHYSGSITWNCSEGVFKGDREYTATIVLTADTGYTFIDDLLVEISDAYLVNWQVFGSGDGNRLRIVAVYEKTEAESEKGNTNDQNGLGSNSESSQNGGNDSSQITAGTSQTTKTTQTTGTTQSSNSASGSTSGSADTSTSSDSTRTASLAAAVATIGSNDQAKVSIQVDELDILSIENGQTAEITLDAIEGESFEGTVNHISQESSGDSGNAKYTVDITLNRTGEMLVGMSASATIQIGEVNEAVLIPMSALQEDDGRVFVYTAKDDEDNLTGEVEVETGLSDGSQVEITSGLSEGDKVYYMRSGTDSGMEDFSEGNMMMPDNVEFGGEMPGGGFGGDSSGRPGSMPQMN